MAKKILTIVAVAIIISIAISKAGSPGQALDNLISFISNIHVSNG